MGAELNPNFSQASTGTPRSIPQKLLRAAEDVREAAELTAMGWQLLREFLRHDFNKREFRVVCAILVETYSFEATSVWIPEDRVLPLLTGITSNNLPPSLRRLVESGVLERRGGNDSTWELRILPNSRDWKVGELHKREDVEAARRALRRMNDDKQLKLVFRTSEDFAREFQDAIFDAKLAEASNTKGNVSLNLSERANPGEETRETVSLKLSESGAEPSARDPSHALNSSGTGRAITGTGTERLFTVSPNEQKKGTAIIERAVRALPLAYATRAQRRYYQNFFSGPNNPAPEIVARALWAAALQYEVSDKTGIEHPPSRLTQLYFDERDRLLTKLQNRRAVPAVVALAQPESNADATEREAIRKAQHRELLAAIGHEPKLADSANAP